MQGITFRIAGPEDASLLTAIPDGLFDEAITPARAARFLADPLYCLILAFDGALVVGKASGTVLLSPDKEPGFFVNEVDVRDGWRQRGIARAMLAHLFAQLLAEGIDGAWRAMPRQNPRCKRHRTAKL